MDIPVEISSKTVIPIDSNDYDSIGFYPRDDFLLLEVYGRVKESIFSIRKTVTQYVVTNKKPVAFRACGSAINLVTTIVHLMRTEEDIYSEDLHLSTFSVQVPKQNRLQTGIQIIVFPKEE